MRIISQNKNIDLPYESIGVSIHAQEGTNIIAYPINRDEENFWSMAKYSNAEKVKKALEMLHNACGKCGIFFFPEDEEIQI